MRSKCCGLHLPALLALFAWWPSAALGQAPTRANLLTPPAQAHVRLMTWNIAANSIFDDAPKGSPGYGDGERPARFRRLLKALAPDVICLQDVIAPHSADDVAQILDAVLPLPEERPWQAHGKGDVAIVSRYSLTMRESRSEDWGGGAPRAHAMARVDLPAAMGDADLYVICAHLQSHSKPKDLLARQEQADAIAAWVHDLRTPGGQVNLAPRTPIVLLGDWSAYRNDPARHIATLLSGDIVNQKRFGPGGPPDWNDAPLLDALPLVNAAGANYTFGDGTAGDFPPSALDRVLYTGSVLELLNGFVLDTTRVDPELLTRNGLLPADVLLDATPPRYDHLPVVVDLALKR